MESCFSAFKTTYWFSWFSFLNMQPKMTFSFSFLFFVMEQTPKQCPEVLRVIPSDIWSTRLDSSMLVPGVQCCLSVVVVLRAARVTFTLLTLLTFFMGHYLTWWYLRIILRNAWGPNELGFKLLSHSMQGICLWPLHYLPCLPSQCLANVKKDN